MRYQIYKPCLQLSPYIKCYWSMEKTDGSLPTEIERIFPDGHGELIFHYGDLFRKYDHEAKSTLQPRSFIHGQIKKHMDIEASGNTGIFGVRFLPNGISAFTRCDVSQITERYVDIKDFWSKGGDILEDKMLNAPGDQQRVGIIEDFFTEQLGSFQSEDRVILQGVREIIRRGGDIKIETLASDLNIGRRHLERRFVSSVGISPKLLSRIVRFQNTLQLIKYGTGNLTGIAYAGGFYDQAHFIKDFKEFTGLNPTQYFSDDLVMAKFFTTG